MCIAFGPEMYNSSDRIEEVNGCVFRCPTNHVTLFNALGSEIYNSVSKIETGNGNFLGYSVLFQRTRFFHTIRILL